MKRHIKRVLMGTAASVLVAPGITGAAHAANGDTLTVNGSCYQSQNGRCKPQIEISKACGVSWRLIGGTVNAVHGYAGYEPWGWNWSGPDVYQNGIGNLYAPDWGYLLQFSNTPSSTRTFSIRYRVDTGGCTLKAVNAF